MLPPAQLTQRLKAFDYHQPTEDGVVGGDLKTNILTVDIKKLPLHKDRESLEKLVTSLVRAFRDLYTLEPPDLDEKLREMSAQGWLCNLIDKHLASGTWPTNDQYDVAKKTAATAWDKIQPDFSGSVQLQVNIELIPGVEPKSKEQSGLRISASQAKEKFQNSCG
jgi:hypothetical protein